MASQAQFSPVSLLTRSGVSRVGIPAGEATRLDAAFVSSSLLLNCLGLLLPIATLHVFDRVIPNGAIETLLFLTGGLILAAMAEFALRRMRVRVNALAATSYANGLRRAALAGQLAQPSSSTLKEPTSVQLERLNAIERFTAFYAGGARTALIDLPFAALALGLIAILGGVIVLAPIGVILLNLALTWWLSAAIRERMRVRHDDAIKANDFLSEIFSAIHTVKCWALERLILRRYERLLGAATDNHRKTLILNHIMQGQSIVFANLTTVATLAVGGTMAIYDQVTIGVVAASTLLAGRAAQPALRAAKAWSDVQRATLSAEEVRELFEAAPPPPPARRMSTGAAPALSLLQPERTFPAGSILLVEGLPPEPQTEFLEAVAGLARDADPAARSPLLLDGQPPWTYRAAHPGGVAFVPRAPRPWAGAIIENLTVFGRGANEAIALEVAHRIGLGVEIQKLPRGYDTLLDAGSSALSQGGVVQLAVARAIAMDAQLILLDEPAAHLSTGDIERLRDELARRAGASTILIGTQNPMLREVADQTLRVATRATELEMGSGSI